MALKIRLARGGSKKRPYYRIVVAENTSPRDGRFIERVGSYNPMLPSDHAERIILKSDRAHHWLSVGAKPTDRVSRMFTDAGLIKGSAPSEQTKKNQPRKKAQERIKAEEARLEALKEAEAKAVAEPEIPAEDAPAE